MILSKEDTEIAGGHDSFGINLIPIRELNTHELDLIDIDLRTSTKVSFDITNVSQKKIAQLIKILEAGRKVKGWSLLVLELHGTDIHIEAVRPNKEQFDTFELIENEIKLSETKTII